MFDTANTNIERDRSDSEWEYEYDAEETETFYVTLDLSSATHEALSRIQRGKPEAAPGGAVAPTPDGSTADRPAKERRASLDTETETSNPRIQFLELNSVNPFVSFDGHLYSCSWSRTIGTDLILAEPNEQLPFEPVYREAGFQIAALSDIRLIGSTANLMPKQATVASTSATVDTQANGIAISVPETASNDKRKQAAFLERIAAVKRAKGDKDEVFIAKGRSYADYTLRSEQSQDLDGRSGVRANARDSDQKGKGKAVLRAFGGGIEPSESSSARLKAAGPSDSMDAAGEGFTHEREGEQLPPVSARVLRHSEAPSDAIQPAIEMRDAG